MRIKQLLTKTLLAAAGLCVGASAWAQITTMPFSTGFDETIAPFDKGTIATSNTTIGNVFQVTSENSGAKASFAIDGVAYALKDNEQVTIQFKAYCGWLSANSSATVSVNAPEGKSLASYTYAINNCNITDISLGGKTATGFPAAGLGAWNCRSVMANGSGCNGLTNNSYVADDARNPLVTIKISKSGIVSLNYKLEAKSIDATYSATLSDVDMVLDNITITTNCSNSDRAYNIDNLSISSEIISTPVYSYTLNYQLDGKTVASVSGSGYKDSEITAESPIWNDGKTAKYYVKDGATTTFTLTEETNVFNVPVRAAKTWTATIKAVDTEKNVIGDAKTATGIEDESLILAHSVAAEIDGVWYETSRINDYRHTLTEASPTVNVTYTPSNRIDFYFDNEDYTVVNRRDGGYLPERGASSFDAVRLAPNGYLYTPELKAGVYNLTVNKNNSNSSEASLAIELLNGDDKISTEKSVTQSQDSYYQESIVEGIVIPADGYRLQLANNTTWNSNMSVDYMILTFVRPVNVSPSVTDYATFSSPYALDFTSATGVKAYYASASDGSVVEMTKVTGAVAAGTGLLLQKVDGEISIPTATTGTDLSATNLLKAGTGADVVSDAEYSRYVLAGEGDATSFYNLATAYAVPVGKAYLEVAKTSGARLAIVFSDDETTGIANVEKTSAVAEGIYNLNGQRVAAPQKGLYIVNGKKVIKK